MNWTATIGVRFSLWPSYGRGKKEQFQRSLTRSSSQVSIYLHSSCSNMCCNWPFYSLQRGIMFSLRPSVPLSILMSVPSQLPAVVAGQWLYIATMAVGQHAVRVGESIPVPTWTCTGGESIPVQKWYSPQGGQVHYTSVGASNDCGWYLAV